MYFDHEVMKPHMYTVRSTLVTELYNKVYKKTKARIYWPFLEHSIFVRGRWPFLILEEEVYYVF